MSEDEHELAPLSDLKHTSSLSCKMSLSSSSRHALIVGGTSGIGHGIAVALAKRGDISITIAGRSESRGTEIVGQLKNLSPNQTHEFVQVDGFDLSSFKKLTSTKPDLLVMTQGMATIQGYTPTTKDGLDQKLQLHYFSRIYLARLLAPKMKNGGRILTVLSAGVHQKYKYYNTDFELKEHYSVRNAADAAGFYTDAGFERLAEEYPNLLVAHAAPGFVNTNWGTEFPWYLRGMVRGMQVFGKSAEQCGEDLVKGWLDVSSSSSGNFVLLNPKGEVIEGGIKHSKEERDFIWEKTLELLPDV